MSNEIIFISLYTLSVLIASISQILLKKSALKSYKSKLYEYLNPLVLIAYTMFFATTLMNVFALRYVELSTGAVIESTGYIFVGVLSFLILKEKYSKRKLIGTLLILLGIIIFAI